MSQLRPGAQAGLILMLISAAAFGTSGPFAKSLLVTGWSPGAIVLLRVGFAALILAPFTIRALVGRWHLVRDNLGAILAFGGLAVAGCQVAYFQAVERLAVGVALLLEYLGIILVVLWVWLRSRKAPGVLTRVGLVAAVIGLVLVLDLTAEVRLDGLGVMWGLLAAGGLAVFFVVAASPSTMPPLALAGLSLGVGAVLLGLCGLVGIVPMEFHTLPVTLLGAQLPWWVPIIELAAIAAALAYAVGTMATRRLGSTLASFVGLAEVLFAVLFAWILLGELPGPIQLFGGVFILGAVALVRLESMREAARAVVDSPASTDRVSAELRGRTSRTG